MRGRFMAKPTRSKMDADPNPVLFVRENVDIMIAAADGTELFGGDRLQIAERFYFPRRIVKKFMFNSRFTFASNAERNVVNHVVHDLVDLRRNFFPLGV